MNKRDCVWRATRTVFVLCNTDTNTVLVQCKETLRVWRNGADLTGAPDSVKTILKGL